MHTDRQSTPLSELDSFGQALTLGLSPAQAAQLDALSGMEPFTAERYAGRDIGSGNLYADFYRDTARFVRERKCWFIYDGRAWRADTAGLRAMEKCKRLAQLLHVLAQMTPDPAVRDMHEKRARRWDSRTVRETILKDAAGVYPLSMDDFDRDPYLLNCANGTLNLKSGAFSPHRAGDWLTMVCGAAYDPAARCERWETFMDEVMSAKLDVPEQTALDLSGGGREKEVCSAQQKKRYLQKALGYALTGDTHHECFFILYGATTRNGKGTTMETFLRLMGDYGKTASPETIGVRVCAGGSAPSEDVARLAGARFVNISEPDKKLTLSAALVKQLTGNDTITARYLHENSFEFRPRFKMFINTNYLPQITDQTLFSSGRVKTIPFERHFTQGEQDRGLKALFAKPENLSGILNWCLEGLSLLEEEGFDEPQAVREATQEYARESDKILLFLGDCMEKAPGVNTRTSDVYARYKRWCEENGYGAENVRNFRALLSQVARVEKRRPACNQNATSMLMDYRTADDDSWM